MLTVGTWRSGPVPVMFRFCWVLTGCMPFTQVVTTVFWERGSGKVLYYCHAFRVLFTQTGKCRYMILHYACKIHGRLFGVIVLNVCARPYADQRAAP